MSRTAQGRLKRLMNESIVNLEHSLSTRMIETLIERWSARTRDLSEEPPHLPLQILLGEAMDVAELIEVYYPTSETPKGKRLGLESVARHSGVDLGTATQLRELQLVIGKVHSRYLVLLEKVSRAPIERAEELLSELRSALGFLLNDGKHATGETQLARLTESFVDARSHDGMALALQGYAELGAQYRVDLIGLGGFDISSLDEAVAVGLELRQRSADRLSGALARRQRQTLLLRNRLIHALEDTLNNVRRTFRFVFRKHPDIVRKVGSQYRRQAKREERKSAPPDSNPTLVSGETSPPNAS